MPIIKSTPARSLARSLFLARLQTCRQESVCIRAFRKACRCHSSSAYPPRRSERKFKSVSVYFNFILCPGWVFVSALWEIQSYLLAGIKSSREKPTVSTAFCLKQITWGGRDWFMSHGSFFLFQSVDMSVFFTALIFVCNTWASWCRDGCSLKCCQL